MVGDEERARALAALRDAFRDDALRVDRRARWRSTASTTCPARSSSATSTRRRPAIAVSSRRRARRPAARRRCARTFERYWRAVRGAPQRRPATDGVLRPTSSATSTAFVRLGQRERALALARLAASATSGRAAWNAVGARSSWRDPRGAALHRRHAAHLGRLDASSARCAACSPYERESDARAGAARPACRRSGRPAEPGVGVKRLPTHYGVLNYDAAGRGPDDAPPAARPATSTCRPAASSCSRRSRSRSRASWSTDVRSTGPGPRRPWCGSSRPTSSCSTDGR